MSVDGESWSIVQVEQISEIVSRLRESGNDTFNIEVKAAEKGLPADIDETISAFANMPEGGLILLGLTEGDGSFKATGVYESKTAQTALGGKARDRIVPAVQLGAVGSVTFEGHPVVYCVVPPQAPEHKPFKVGSHGPAFIRSADGNYHLHANEEALLVSKRRHPNADRAPVEGATLDDLDPHLVEMYLTRQRRDSRRLGTFTERDQLIHTNVIDSASGAPTVAAVYAMGVHPQRFLPHLSVKVHQTTQRDALAGVRMRDKRQFSGPVPDLLDSILEWVQDRLSTAVLFSGGHGKETPEIPLLAVREIVANALVHRDLSAASADKYVQLVKQDGKLIVSNPGGLWGITTRQLGTTGPSARNPVLYDMCNAITTSDGNNVIEASATGIPATRRAMREAFLPEPFFQDRVIGFTAILTSSALISQSDAEWVSSLPGSVEYTVAQRHALVAMRNGTELTNAMYREEFPMDSVQARNELRQLVTYGLVETVGQGRGTTYRLIGHDATVEEKPTSGSVHGYLSMEEKTNIILSALEGQSKSLRKREIIDHTGLSEGQVTPALKKLRETGQVQLTNEIPTARGQRYRRTY